MRHHRLEHLGGDDHGDLGAARLADDLLLDVRHVLQRHVHAEVAAGDHDRVDDVQDTGQVGEDLVPLELGDQRHVVGALGPQEAPHFLDVAGRAHERDRDEVDALPEAEFQIFAVLVGQAGHRQRHVRQREPLVVADAPTGHHPAPDLVR